MPLSGVHVLCTSVRVLNGASLTAESYWSETLTSPATTTKQAPQDSLLFEVSAGVDAYVAWGAFPDASQLVGSTYQSARKFISAGTKETFYCRQGDKVAWTAA